MANDTIKETFTETRSLNRENSFGTVATAKDIELTVDIGFSPSTGRGWFEFYDEEQDWYASGGLRITDGALTDYDGVFALPDFVIDWLQSQGVDVTEMRRVMNE
jgi:glutamate dehydrogenase/leucine dehydrogenase